MSSRLPRLLRFPRATALLCACGALLGAGTAAAQDPVPVLVKDIWTRPLPWPTDLIALEGTLIFAATDPVNGTELWRSDGTLMGTTLVADIAPDVASSTPTAFAKLGNTLFFVADDGVHGRELWRTDGTAGGTALVADIAPGAGGSFPAGLVAAGSAVFFAASDGVHGSELWRSDGSAGGTTLVADINPGPSGSRPAAIAAIAAAVYFRASNGSSGDELWRSDGTASGTVLVKDIVAGAGGSAPRLLTSVGGALLFVATTTAAGEELWRSDGTAAGTVLAKDIRPGPDGAATAWIVASGDVAFLAADDGGTGVELWRSDGTAAGTALVSDIWPGLTSSTLSRPTIIAGVLYFAADDGHTGRELWRSDGTPGGTAVVVDLNYSYLGIQPRWLTDVNGTLFFEACWQVFWPRPYDRGCDLWKSDGTADGTAFVGAVFVPQGPPLDHLTAVDGVLFFVSAERLWRADDATAGIVRVGDFPVPSLLTPLDGVVLFQATDEVSGAELWRSDGTASGTVRVSDIAPGPAHSTPTGLTRAGGVVFFAASDGTSGRELWQSDGTAGGTVLVKDIAGGAGGSSPGPLWHAGGTLYFVADDGVTGRELWRSDGTATGTALVADINPGAGSSMPEGLVMLGRTLYFVADDGVAGRELWRSDGTAVGTRLVRDIAPGAAGAFPPPGAAEREPSRPELWLTMAAVGGTLFFAANDGASGTELWRSDGTDAGTLLARDILPGVEGSSPSWLTDLNGAALFVADDGTTGRELWRSDGTATGTSLLRDIYSGPASSYGQPRWLVTMGGTLYFAGHQFNGELWRSDGTPGGTQVVKAFPPHGLLSQLTPVNGMIYFAGEDALGSELWRSDGSEAGTLQVADLRPGDHGSKPSSLTPMNGTLFFVADDGVHGPEAWKVPTLPGLVLSPATSSAVVGGSATLHGLNFTAGSVVKLYVAIGAGALAFGPYSPASWTPTTLVFDIPPDVPLGHGFASIEVINTDEGYRKSNTIGVLLHGDPADNIPTVTHLNDVAPGPADLVIGLAHIDTVMRAGDTLTIGGTGFNNPLVNLFTAAGNLGPLAPLAGGTGTRIQVVVPAPAPTGPGTVQVVNAPYVGNVQSNDVASVIGAVPTISRVAASGSTVTVSGTGFCALSVVNLFNEQVDRTVVNLGGFGPDGRPRIPLHVASDTQLSFGRPAGAVTGPAFLEVLNPPFIPFASSGSDPDGAFSVPAPVPLTTAVTAHGEAAASADTLVAAHDAGARSGPWAAAESREVVRWARAVGTAVIDGPTLRTPAVHRGGLRAGARSTRALVEGDGHVTWTVQEEPGDVAFGFGHDDVDGSLPDLEHAFRLDAATRELTVYERGARQAGVGTCATGDRLRIAVQDGVVQYQHNGAVVWVSLRAPRYPLIVDASLGAGGANVSGVQLTGRLATVVEWPARAEVTASSMRVTASRAASAGGPLVLVMPSGPEMESAATRTVSAELRGAAGIGFGTTRCDYCIRRVGDDVEVRHEGAVRGRWNAESGTRVRVEVRPEGIVRYWAGEVRLDEAPRSSTRGPCAERGLLAAPGAAIVSAVSSCSPGR